MDTLSKEKRSWLMSRVKGTNTSPERLVFSYLRKNKIHFQRHYRRAPGSPDIALPKRKIAVFINGDFWHGRYYTRTKRKLLPFWREKIADNMRRGKRNLRKLRSEGWRVLNVWTGDLKKRPAPVLAKIASFLTSKR